MAVVEGFLPPLLFLVQPLLLLVQTVWLRAPVWLLYMHAHYTRYITQDTLYKTESATEKEIRHKKAPHARHLRDSKSMTVMASVSVELVLEQ